MTFKEAVEDAPPPVNRAYRSGKSALERRHRNCVACTDPCRLTGSIDLDRALSQEPGYADKPRWDYGLGYRPARGPEQAVWVEVHWAATQEVCAVLGKLQGLKDWLNAEARQLQRMTRRTDFVWIASGRDGINRNSRQYRQLAQSGLPLLRRLKLP